MNKNRQMCLMFIMFLLMLLVPPAASATCSPAKISPSPVSLNAITGSADSVTNTTSIADDCGNPLEYTATVTGGSSWLTLPASGKDSLTVTANIKGMAPGTYTGMANIKTTGLAEAVLTVTLTIGSACSATIDQTLKLNAPIIKYTDPASNKQYFWIDEVYTSDPSKVLFKVSGFGSQNTTGYNCNMSWLDSDLIIYVRDVLLEGNFYWLKLAYDTSLSDSSNYYFYAKNYGAGSMSGVDSNLYFGFSYGTTNTTNPVTGSTVSVAYGNLNSGTVSFEVILTNGAASELVGVLGYLNSDYSLSKITRGIFAKITSDGQKVFHKIDFGPDGLPTSLSDHSTGHTIYFSGYSNGTVHIKVVDSAGVVVVSDKKINIEGEWFTYFSTRMARSSAQKDAAAAATLSPAGRAANAEKTLKAIGYAMGTIFDKTACVLAPATNAGKLACGGLVAAATSFGCDLTKTKDGLCDYIKVVPEGLAGGPTLASCVADIATQPIGSNTGSSVVDCTKGVAATVIKTARVNFLKEITPSSGAVGTAVTITGSGFGTTKGTVTFNGITAIITSWTETEIKTTVPTGATTGHAVVTDTNGVASNGVMFTVITLSVYTVIPSPAKCTGSQCGNTYGSLSPNTPQTVTQGATIIFTLTPNTGYTASVSGTCGGTLSGNTYTTRAITADCTVEAYFTPCITLSPAKMDFPLSGGNGTINITASGSSCSWKAGTNETWITLTSATSGTGNGTVAYSVAPNSGAARVGAIMLGGQSLQGVKVTQAGVSVCTNTAPAISVSGGPATATVGTAITATVTVTDIDVGNNPTLTVNYGAVIGNTWSWTPASAGVYTITLTANDGQACNNTTSKSFTITVSNAQASRYTDNGNGTVTDNTTGLTWQQVQNNSGNATGFGGYNWYMASGTYDATYNVSSYSVCGSLSLAGGGWRLPTLTELQSLVDASFSPTINTNFFPGTFAISYWSSTTDASYTLKAWNVHFGNGVAYSSSKVPYGTTYAYPVRCVR